MKRKDDGIDVKGKAPSFPFYPADMERDVKLLSLAATGLWTRIMGTIHFAPRRGFLEHETGIPMNNADIARLVGVTEKEAAKLIAELERLGTFSRDERGCIYNRRMVREAEVSRKRKEAGVGGYQAVARGEDGKFAREFNGQTHGQNAEHGRANARAKVDEDGDGRTGKKPFPSSSFSFSFSPKENSGDFANPDGQNSGQKPAAPPFDPVEVDFDGLTPLDWFEREFKGEWHADTWREFGHRVSMSEHLVALRENVPLWMQTSKYRSGYGKDSIQFLRSGCWRKPPSEALMGEEKRRGNARAEVIEASRKSLEELDVKPNW